MFGGEQRELDVFAVGYQMKYLNDDLKWNAVCELYQLILDKIRRIGKDCVEYSVADTTKNIQERRTYGDLNECVLGHMAHHMRLCLMRPTGEPRPDAPVIQKLLDLVKGQFTP